MPTIRNLALLKRFTDYFKLKAFDSLDSQAGRMLVPVVNLPVPANVILVPDVTLNDIDKRFTVPDGKQWKILTVFVELVTTATAGNRRIQLRIDSAGGARLWNTSALNVQIASTTERYNFQRGTQEPTEPLATQHFIPLPLETILPSGFSIRIQEVVAVDVLDDMTVQILLEETDVEDI